MAAAAATAAPVHTSPSASRVREVTKNLLLCDGVCKGRKRRGESDDAYFRRQSHLSLDGRRLQQLGAALSSCPQLQILYLYDNQLTSLQGLSTTLLTHLYVQNNELTDGPELAAALGSLRQLQKLYISHNRLTDLSPLCSLPLLEELHAGNQRGFGGGVSALVLPPELAELSRLRVLTLPQNGLRDAAPIGSCSRLQKLDLSGNQARRRSSRPPLAHLPVSSHPVPLPPGAPPPPHAAARCQVTDLGGLATVLSGCGQLEELDLRGNPRRLETPRPGPPRTPSARASPTPPGPRQPACWLWRSRSK